MKFRQQARRGLAVTVVLFMMFGTQAFASSHVDDSTITITAASVAPSRGLTVTGSSLAGPAVLSFGSSASTATFGVIVSDVAYDDVDYRVTAALSDLYRVDPTQTGTDGLDCSEAIHSGAFSINGYGAVPGGFDRGIEAVVEPVIEFTGDLSGFDPALLTILDGLPIITGNEIDVIIDGLLSLPTALSFMDVRDGDTDDFAGPETHSVCPTRDGADPTSSIEIQTGDALNPSLADLAQELLDYVTSVVSAASMTAQEAIDADLISESELNATIEDMLTTAGLNDLLLAPTGETVESVATLIVPTLVAEVDDVTITATELLGRTGLYPNLPQLSYDGFGAPMGLYRGEMTITLFDVP